MVDVLVFGAHPDDAEFGMGASIVKFVKDGKDVTICVLTRGESGTHGTTEQREKEMRDAASKAGAKLEILDFHDCKIFDNYENRLKIAAIIRKLKPRIVFSPYHTNEGGHADPLAHPDHFTLGNLVRFGARYARFRGLKDLGGEAWKVDRVVYYMLPRHISPNLFNDVSCCIKEWIDIAKTHESQMNLLGGEIENVLLGMRKSTGRMMGVEYGEVFYTDSPVDIDKIF